VNISAVVAEALLSGRADAIIAADRAGIIRFWNPGAERIFGYARQEALEQSLNLIIPERLRQRHWDGYNHFMQTGYSRYADSDLLSVPSDPQRWLHNLRGVHRHPVNGRDWKVNRRGRSHARCH
jgi:PAS domain-containing protein